MAARQRHSHNGHGAEWVSTTTYVAMLVGGIALMDSVVDLLHWLGSAWS